MEQQIRGFRRGVELVVACPGRLLDHLLKGTLDLSNVEVLVIDEADRMFDMGFLPDIRSIVRCLTKPHQTLLFSATMPDDIRRLVQEVLHDPLTVQIGHSAPVEAYHMPYFRSNRILKLPCLKEILRATETDSVLIFTRTKHRVERVAEQLRRAGYKVASLQGDMTQYRRQDRAGDRPQVRHLFGGPPLSPRAMSRWGALASRCFATLSPSAPGPGTSEPAGPSAPRRRSASSLGAREGAD